MTQDNAVTDVSQADFRQPALERIDQIHAALLRSLTGNATPEERDTWPRKLMAAQAIASGSTDDVHTRPLAGGAQARGLSVGDYAARILAKDAAFAQLISDADEMRERAQLAVMAALDLPLDQVAAAITAALSEIETAASAAR